MTQVSFQSLRSGSSGNCLALWDDDTSLLFDLGVSSQRGCGELLAGRGAGNGTVDAVFVSHAHGDHVNSSSLKFLGKSGIAVHGHRSVLDQLAARHAPGEWKQPPRLRPLPSNGVQLGRFSVSLVGLTHAPGYPNFGFLVRHGRLRMVLATDFNDVRALEGHLPGADFVFLESNHDLELLRRHYNPASLFHLNNPQAARALHVSIERAKSAPRAVMLGHLSEDRNTPHLALEEMRAEFRRTRTSLDFELLVAPRHRPSPVVRLDGASGSSVRPARRQPVQGRLFS